MPIRVIAFAGCFLASLTLSCSPPQAENVELVGSIGGPVRAVAVNGDYAYVGEGRQVTILDVSDPAAPEVLAKLRLADVVRGIAVSGSLVYAVAGIDGFQVIDVSDPSAPVRVGFYKTPGQARGVAVSGTVAYVADSGHGLAILRYTGPIPPPR